MKESEKLDINLDSWIPQVRSGEFRKFSNNAFFKPIVYNCLKGETIKMNLTILKKWKILVGDQKKWQILVGDHLGIHSYTFMLLLSVNLSRL